MDTCLGDFYLRPERPSLAALHLEVRRKLCEQQFPAPNSRMVSRRVEALDLKFVTKQREGSKKAREKLGLFGVSTLRPASRMNVLQIDHMPVDVIVVDQEHPRPTGRPVQAAVTER